MTARKAVITTVDVQQRLQQVQERAAAITAVLHQVEAERDSLLCRLTDYDGAHDRRPGCGSLICRGIKVHPRPFGRI
jgi:hypothetical protein